jgi:lipopolysaccharide export system protein LptA
MSVSVSVERLRVWLLVGAGLLVMVVAAFLGYAHYRAHRFLTALPGKLGIDVRQETNNWTYSQTAGGKTIYTVHAAKSIQHKDGKYTLHDVGIVVYGKNQDRADRIYGSEFEYDPTAEVIRAMGEVFIDLQAPEAQDRNAKMDYAAGKDLAGTGAKAASGAGASTGGKNGRLIHIKTSGLVYMQKLGVAATDNDIEFTVGGLVGHAVGADYNSDTGVVILHSAVKVNGLQHERPVVLTASYAVLDRQGQTATLTQARYVAVGSGTGETAQAQHVLVYLRKDGTAERLQAEGAVTLTNGEGGTATAPRGEMTLSAENHPESAMLTGGVKYGEDRPRRQAQGESADTHLTFDKAGRVQHVTMTGTVRWHERVRVSDVVGEAWSERNLSANAVELAMAADAAGKTEMRDAKATGDARLTVLNPAVKGGGATRSALAGDVLTVHFVRVNGADHIAEVHGEGHTVLRKVGGTGVVNTSSADSLVAEFRPVAGGVSRGAAQGQQVGRADAGRLGAGGQGSDEIVSAVEQGHVVMTQMPVRKPGDSAAPQEERATAERAVYDGDLQRMTLTGNVQVNDGTNVLWADRVVSEQQTGNATADGSVKVSYRQAGSTDEPMHVMAARGELKHDSQVATFYGVVGRPARLWQAGSQVEAPVLEFEQKQRRLLAHGEGEGGAMVVHTVLVSSGGSGSGKPSAGTSGRAAKTGAAKSVGGKTSVVRVASRELVYSDEARTADFTGGVLAESSDGTMRGERAVVYLQGPPASGKVPAANGGKAGAAGGGSRTEANAGAGGKVGAAGGFMGGSVERVVATGHIELEQPGRRATGERLVYTASDGMFILTGTTAVLPKVVDQQQGTVTGASLRFHAGDENVVVSNGGDNAGQRVHTETRVKNKQ